MANPVNYVGAAAFSVALEMSTRWQHVWIENWPLIALLKGSKGNFNNGTKNTEGTGMILPIVLSGPGSSTRNATDANQTVPMTPDVTQGQNQAFYYYSTFEKPFTLNIQEREQLKGKTNMVTVISMKADQLMFQFTSDINAQAVGTQNGTGRTGNGMLTGEQYIIATSNVVGGIDQSANAQWASTVITNAGAFNEALLLRQYRRINDLGRGKVDIVQASYSDANDIYSKIDEMVQSAQQIVTKPGGGANGTPDWGFETIMWKGCYVYPDGRLGDVLPGSIGMLRSGSWWINENEDAPVLAPDGVRRMTGTSTDEHFYVHTLAIGNNDPATNALIENVS